MAALMDLMVVSTVWIVAAKFLTAHQGGAASQYFSDNLNFERAERVDLHDIGPGAVMLKQGFYGAGLEPVIPEVVHR